jgi:hypothetical protein
MSFYKKYELDRLMADGEARTFRAVENSTGRVVFLHLFNPSGQPLLEALKSKSGAPGKPVAPLIEIGEFAGAPYAVTQAIEPFRNLRDWISANVTASNPPATEDLSPPALPAESPLHDRPGGIARLAEPSQPPPPASPPSDFTRLFAPARPHPPVPPPPSISPPPASGLVAEEPGEFTRLFEPSPPHPPVPPPPSVPPPPASGLVAEEPGEFTRLFEPSQPHPPVPPPPLPTSPPPAAGLVAEEPGEFTRFFQPSPPHPPASRPPAGGPAADEPGEFTRFFEPSQSGPPASPPPAASQPYPAPGAPPPPENPRRPPWPPSSPETSAQTGEFTRLFGSTRLPGEAIDIEKEHASASRAAPPENRPFQAAGEFTRMFGPEGAKGASTPAGAGPPPSLHTPFRTSSASGMFGDPDDLAKAAAEVLSGGKPADSVPDEYSRIFGAPKNQAEPPQPAAPAAPAAPLPETARAKKFRGDIVAIVASVVVLAALIVAAIVFRK